MESLIFEEWSAALVAAYSLAKAKRGRELARRSARRYTVEGLDSYSEEWGRVRACEALLPGLSDLRFTGEDSCSPTSMLHTAADEADDEWKQAA